MIGIPLVDLLVRQGAEVRVASLDDQSRAHPDSEFFRLDLTLLENCLRACEGMDFVFNLLGVKASPGITMAKPASYMYPTVMMEFNLLEAAYRQQVPGYLLTSSVGVYAQNDVLYEDNVWKTFPSPKDWFAGWSKRIGEIQVEAYRREYQWQHIAIVRPANVYGEYDNFDSENAMVVPSLIKRAINGENPLVVWGDGTAIRDFINAKDVARAMLIVAEKMPGEPVNLGSGKGTSIRQLIEIIISNLDHRPEVVWDTSKPVGDNKRILDMARASSLGFNPEITLEQGIRQTMQWYRNHRNVSDRRYDVYSKTGLSM